MQDVNLWKLCVFERRFGTETDGQAPGSRYSFKKVIIIRANFSENYVLKFAKNLNVKIAAMARKIQFPLLVSHTKYSYLKIIMLMPLVSLAFFSDSV
jgi:hypothetical protein